MINIRQIIDDRTDMRVRTLEMFEWYSQIKINPRVLDGVKLNLLIRVAQSKIVHTTILDVMINDAVGNGESLEQMGKYTMHRYRI